MEGRRIFANTLKYVLMATSSNFGNMFSAAGASLFLSFLPMLPSQILLNNLLYDVGQLAIPDRPRRPGGPRPARGVGHRLRPALHGRVRPGQLDLRLRDVLRDARRAERGSRRVPHRVVRRVARDADPRHLRDPHAPRAVRPQPAEPGHDRAPDHVRAQSASLLPFTPLAPALGFTAAAARVLPDPARDDRRRTSCSSRWSRRASTPASLPRTDRAARPTCAMRIASIGARRASGIRAHPWFLPSCAAYVAWFAGRCCTRRGPERAMLPAMALELSRTIRASTGPITRAAR